MQCTVVLMFRKRSKPKFVSLKWLRSRTIRQDACIEVLAAGSKQLDQNFFDALNEKRSEYDKQFWKVAVLQLTVTSFLMLSLIDLKGISFSIFGLSAGALANAREFLLFCHAMTIGFGVVIQQHVHKLEDVLVAHARQVIGDNKPDNEELKIYLLRYLSPIETFNLIFLPYRKHLFYNRASKIVLSIHNISRAVTAMGFVAFTILVPIIASFTIWEHPNFGWLSYAVFAYWWAVSIFSLASALINVFPLPYLDYSYAMKLQALQQKDPERHKQVMAEIARMGKLPEI